MIEFPFNFDSWPFFENVSKGHSDTTNNKLLTLVLLLVLVKEYLCLSINVTSTSGICKY